MPGEITPVTHKHIYFALKGATRLTWFSAKLVILDSHNGLEVGYAGFSNRWVCLGLAGILKSLN